MKFSALSLFTLASLAIAAPAPEANGDEMSLSDVTKLIEKGEAKVEIANAKECKYRCCNNFAIYEHYVKLNGWLGASD
ncbi:hypothetical protein CDV36_000025 [Fusarium kuroshium]|uniref:Uncharacterized protein n=2 Tax=Fusarium solani species complex TaxID=232080 RepID=A0A3M2SRU7_9HYPO|nr:hypothetical protein CDV36_000025 [Fusarium kuroshium]RSL90967.1 hypothetical protein CEP51_000494 [Fusarium floridanum]